MVQKEVRSEASSPNSLGPKRDWPEVRGEECRPRTVLSWLLAKWVVGESEEAGRRTMSSHGPENPEEKEITLSWESGYRWPLNQRRNRNGRFSSRPSTRRRSGAVLAVSWERANSNISGLPASGLLRRLPGRLGAWLGRGGRRSPARGSTCRPRYRFGLGRSSSGGRRRAPTATGRLRPGPGDSGGWCITPGHGCWIASVCCCRELLGKALDGVAEQPCLGDGGVEKACLVNVLHLYQVEPEMDHHGGHCLPEGLRHDFRRS